MEEQPASEAPSLPLLATEEDALRMEMEKGDPFYLVAFRLGRLHERLHEHYMVQFSEQKQARQRSVQQGIAWRWFQDDFRAFMSDCGLPLLRDLTRYSMHAGEMPELVAVSMLFARGDLPDPDLDEAGISSSEEVLLAVSAHFRLLFARLCDWLEAFRHLETYAMHANAPLLFQPDAAGRELAGMGLMHRVFPWLDGDTQKQWLESFEQLRKEHARTPRWRLTWEAWATSKARHLKHPELDQAIIILWPLMKQHNWTYRDLGFVLAEVMPNHRGYPCDREQALSTYCQNVLGLQKSGKTGRSASANPLPGLATAKLIFSHRIKPSPPESQA